MSPRAVPYVRLFCPFAFATALSESCTWYTPQLGYCLILFAAGLYLLAGRQFAYRYRWVYGLLFSLWLFTFGYYHNKRYNELHCADHFTNQIQSGHYLIGTISDAPSHGAKLKVPVQVEACGVTPDSLQACSGHILLFLDITQKTDSLRYGDRIGIQASISATEPPKNPYAFDYGRYLKLQNLHHQAFVKTDSLILMSREHGYALWRYAYSCRNRLLTLLHRYLPGQDEYAVAAALLVGYTDDLSEEVRTAYAETGSMHALAVSGTHVGMIYVALMFFLNRLPLRGRSGSLLKTILALLGIWAFTFLTGATASVLRASVMFSVFLVGKLIYRNASIWNILAMSAGSLLLYNPYFLFNAGFQLSYAAVAGMVFFYPYFNQAMPEWIKPLREFRKIFLIGFAAQLGTLPLSLFYFHQFPVYFWLAGWVVVLGGAIFLGGGALLILLNSLSEWLASWCGYALYWLVWGINQVVYYIQHLPGSIITGIWIAGWAAALLYVAIGCVGAALARQQLKWAVAALGIFTMLGCCRFYRGYQQIGQREIVAYCISKQRLLDFFDGQQVISLGDSLTRKQVVFAAQSNRWALGMRKIATFSAALDSIIRTNNYYYDRPFMQFFNQRLVLIDNVQLVNNGSSASLPVDMILLSNNPKVTIADCIKRFPCHLILWDGTNSWKQAARWQSECKTLGLVGHDIRQAGAFIWPAR